MKNKLKSIFIIVILIIIIVPGLIVIREQSKINDEHLKFKKDYEKLNGKTTSSNKKYRSITIPEDNPFVFSTVEEVVDKMNNKDTFIVYFGANWCPWCRSVLNTFIDVSKEYNVKKVYYVDVRPDNDQSKEIRNVYSLDNNGNIYLSHKGTKAYNQFIDKASDVLSSYSHGDVKTLEETKYQGEKRVGAPNFIIIKKGEAVYLTTGISEKQTNPYMDLTKEIKNDMKKDFNNFFKKYEK